VSISLDSTFMVDFILSLVEGFWPVIMIGLGLSAGFGLVMRLFKIKLF
jgi:hypothetical protein